MFLAVVLICLIGAYIIGLKASDKPEKKPWKPKKRLFSDAEMDYSKLHFK